MCENKRPCVAEYLQEISNVSENLNRGAVRVVDRIIGVSLEVVVIEFGLGLVPNGHWEKGRRTNMM